MNSLSYDICVSRLRDLLEKWKLFEGIIYRSNTDLRPLRWDLDKFSGNFTAHLRASHDQ
jgi:hypothetical protein